MRPQSFRLGSLWRGSPVDEPRDEHAQAHEDDDQGREGIDVR